MKSDINKPPSGPEYPCLKQATSGTGLVVLFESYGHGTVVYSGHSVWPLGTRDEEWHMPSFEPFHGEVTLSN